MNDRDKTYLLKELTRTIDESDSTAAFCLCQRWVLKDALSMLKEQQILNSRCVGCPYPNNGLCGDQLYHDALILLKEQEARVMTLDELTEIYVEFKGDNCPIRLTNFDLQKIVKYAVDGDCRLWTGKPTDEQRQAVKWDA